MKRGILYGVGVGPGDPELITRKAQRIIAQAAVLAVPDKGSGEKTALTIAGELAEGKEILLCDAPMVRDEAALDAAYEANADRVCALLGAGAEHVLTPEDVALLLASPQGGRKGMGEAMAFRCVLNKADTPERAAHAQAVAGRLAERGIHSAITYYREEERGGLCWF